MATISFEQFLKKAGGEEKDVVVSQEEQQPVSKIEEQKTSLSSTLKDFSTGFAKGGLEEAIGTARLAQTGGQAVLAAIDPTRNFEEIKQQTGIKSLQGEDARKIDEILKSKNDAEKAGKLTEFVASFLYPVGKTKEISSILGAGKEKVIETADDVLQSGINLRKGVQTLVAKERVTPQLKSSAERIFLEGTAKRTENPLQLYDTFINQSKKSLKDIKVDPPLGVVGEKIGDSFNKVAQQRRTVGAKMGEELKKIGGIKTDISESFATLENGLEEAGLRYNGISKKILQSKESKMTNEDVELLESYIKEFNKLGDSPTIAQIDAFLSKTQGLVNNFKSARNIVDTTNGERLIKNSQNFLRGQFDPKKTGNKNLQTYSEARKLYAELSDFLDEGGRYLGKVTQSGDFEKDASLAKSSVQSLLNNGKKDWLIKLEALTDYNALDESVIALQAMKDAGDHRGLSLLQIISDTGVPTSGAGFTRRILDFGVEQGAKILAGTPEQQTRAFLTDLLRAKK